MSWKAVMGRPCTPLKEIGRIRSGEGRMLLGVGRFMGILCRDTDYRMLRLAEERERSIDCEILS